MLSRNKIAMVLAEFVGTGILTAVVLSVSLVLAAFTLSLGAVSGAHLNPAVTLGLWSVRKVKTLPAIVYVASQLLGASAAYLLYTYFVGQHWNNTGHYEAKVLVAEAVGAFIFSLGWASVVYQRFETGKAAAVVGISLMLGIIVASAGAGGIVNPAVALGVRSWTWGTTVLGPVLGALIGFNLYALLFANPAIVTTISDKKK
jgi:glycerol uptake facilitator-like aquaporin